MQKIKYINKILLITLLIIIINIIPYYISNINLNNNIVELETLKLQNKLLKEELTTLHSEYNIITPNPNYITTKVIQRDIYNFYNEIILYSEDNRIKIGQAVINEYGLIGIISNIKNNKIYVTLLNSDINISIKINDTYGNLNKDTITMLNKYTEINIGDNIYTSGLSNIPEGILIGKVNKIIKKEYDTQVKISFIDNNNLNYVSILINDIY